MLPRVTNIPLKVGLIKHTHCKNISLFFFFFANANFVLFLEVLGDPIVTARLADTKVNIQVTINSPKLIGRLTDQFN